MGYLPDSAIGKGGELHRANNLWNTLVALHRESRENLDDARRAASIHYSEKMDEFDTLQKSITLQKKLLDKQEWKMVVKLVKRLELSPSMRP